jgi:hypothetical protein
MALFMEHGWQYVAWDAVTLGLHMDMTRFPKRNLKSLVRMMGVAISNTARLIRHLCRI